MTTAELLKRRDDLRDEMTNAPHAKRDTQWFRDRANEMDHLNRQLIRMGAIPDPLAPARTSTIGDAELAAQAAAWDGDRPDDRDDDDHDRHDDDDEAWWAQHAPSNAEFVAL